ncbi:uncharacterized protein IUM83_03050 [Phytophthora cinnamomi]|uniref:uncharacterized protein n=1 Tax=Phytophthora cinnamomi TaxID=4785 RepID=UPI00355AA55B|nr:hypothetical protein IUM83_03050 [Phytophthora cinnamomi]
MLPLLGRPGAYQRQAAPAPSKPPPRRKRKKAQTDAEEQSRQQKAKARARRNAYLERQKLVREELKRQVTQLSTQLGRERTNVSPATSAWKVLAAWQQELRQDAEAQQRRLCTEVVARAALTRRFREFLNDRRVSDDNAEVKEAPARPKSVRLELSDAELCEVYAKELETLYAQTDAVLDDCEFDGDASDRKQAWTRNTQSGHFQFSDKYVEDRQLYDEIKDDNTVATRFRVSASCTSSKVAAVLHRIVIRRHKEDERLVIVWRSFLEGEGISTDMHADETGRPRSQAELC